MTFEVGTGSNVGTAFEFAMPLVAYSPERKVSLLYCREISSCATGADNVRKRVAPALGLNIVHEAQTSMAQPDFTAEVLAARNAGAAAIVVYLDNPSLLRIKRTATRQGWSPMIVTGQPTFDERFLKDGGPDAEGVMIGSPLPSWDSPRMADFRAAMSRYVPGGIKGAIGLPAWVGGKLLERVALTFPDKDVTSADVLRGLYGLQGETLGGLVPPLTFREGQANPENLCSIMVRVEKGRFVPRDGDNFFCPR
jgi:branched-chain amino acid transport system substrate-binding protein